MPRIRTVSSATTFGYCTRTTVGFWNVRTLLPQSNHSARFLQLEREFMRYNIDIMGVSEARWLGHGEHNSPTGHTVFLFSGKEVGTDRAAGVGFLLTPAARRSLISWNPVSERLVTARFRTRVRNVTIIQCYAPTEQAPENVKDDFYSRLSATYNRTPRGDIIIVMGDLNAKVGQDNNLQKHVMGKHGVGDRNDNGERFVDFCNTNQLVIGGTMFQHKSCHKVSWVSPTGRTANQIDHFAITRRFRSCLMDVRNRRGADIGSSQDHHLMVASMRLRTAAVQRANTRLRAPRYFTDRLKNPEVMANFKEQLHQRTIDLNLPPQTPVTQHWNAVKSIYRACGDEAVGIPPRGRRQWLADDTWLSISERTEIRALLSAATSDEQRRALLTQYRMKQRVVKRKVRRDKRNRINELARAAQAAAQINDSGTVYKITRQLVDRNLTIEHPVKDVDGRLIISDEEQLKRWRDHFANVLNHILSEDAPPFAEGLLRMTTNSRIRTVAPSQIEIKDAIKSLPNNKAPGIDGIPAEFYKCDPQTAARLLHPLITATWENESFPSEWTDGIINKIPKKGDLRECDNWRGICVLPAVSKIIAKVVLNRLKEHLYSTIDAEQAGFRPGSSCTDHINTVRIIIEQCAEYRSDLHMMFVDFEKAFDSVHRDCLWDALRRRGVPEKIIAIIKATYDGAKCHVLHKGKLSEPFEIHSGVRQGCILSPVLFLIVIGDVLRAALHPHRQSGVRWTMHSFLQHLDYADDICLLAHRILDLSNMAQSLEREASSAGLKINFRKTKVLSLAGNPSGRVDIAGQQIETVERFTYLGSELAALGGTDLDVTTRIRKARAAFGMMSAVWRNNNLWTNTKVGLFKSNVLSVLLYGCCTWKVTTSITRRLQVFVNRCLRSIFRVYWPNRITNVELLRRANMQPLDSRIRGQKWRWIGHTIRKGQSSIARKAMEWNPPGGRQPSRGRPRQTWRRTVAKEAKQPGKTWS